ncbi:hypothetical protein [Colwellia psychrerythraea]|uniref:Uncharacterized protein n=1 Tax=Colwellia psychrerythraea TaxID=28229 RepID=A0A099KTX7_COLPS|nr:hypothetical protein [Colwellia psychrerythraea]KGJ94011.1 hypothetical protein GAB14E_2566 [Colwellia psychrerythraea]
MNNVIKTTLNASVTGALVLYLAACCFTKPIDRSFTQVVNPVLTPKNLKSKEFPDHFLGCRMAINDRSVEDKTRVAKIISNIENSEQDVVLYFHGGLSGQDYMINVLGKNLMKSMFELPNVKRQLYPIFLSYDAHPKDTLPDIIGEKGWDEFTDETSKLLKDTLYKDLEIEFKSAFGFKGLEDEEIEALENEWAYKSFNMVYSASGQHEIKSLTSQYKLTEKQRVYFEDILTAKKIPSDIKLPSKNAMTPSSIDRLADKLNELTSEKSLEKRTYNNKAIVQKSTLSKLRVLRILARFALKVDHGFVATIQEEVLDELKIGKLGKAHWDRVKDHAKQCFSDGRLGLYLIEELIKLQDKRSFKINTLSHSAGSIPTAELINYLGDRTESTLNAVVMLVPAVNQEVFTDFVLPNTHVYKKLELYSLTKKMERKDKVWKSALYSSSLLYAVSSLAERSPALDNMLLIEQHMLPDAFPYRLKPYQCVVGEKPKDLWLAINPDKPDSEFITYPFNGKPEPQKEAASHEGTKYPWLSDDLARRYLITFGVKNTDDLVFPVPNE